MDTNNLKDRVKKFLVTERISNSSSEKSQVSPTLMSPRSKRTCHLKSSKIVLRQPKS